MVTGNSKVFAGTNTAGTVELLTENSSVPGTLNMVPHFNLIESNTTIPITYTNSDGLTVTQEFLRVFAYNYPYVMLATGSSTSSTAITYDLENQRVISSQVTDLSLSKSVILRNATDPDEIVIIYDFSTSSSRCRGYIHTYKISTNTVTNTALYTLPNNSGYGYDFIERFTIVYGDYVVGNSNQICYLFSKTTGFITTSGITTFNFLSGTSSSFGTDGTNLYLLKNDTNSLYTIDITNRSYNLVKTFTAEDIPSGLTLTMCYDHIKYIVSSGIGSLQKITVYKRYLSDIETELIDGSYNISYLAVDSVNLAYRSGQPTLHRYNVSSEGRANTTATALVLRDVNYNIIATSGNTTGASPEYNDQADMVFNINNKWYTNFGINTNSNTSLASYEIDTTNQVLNLFDYNILY